MDIFLEQRNIKLSEDSRINLLTIFGIESPIDFMDLTEDDIVSFVESNNLNVVQGRRFVKAFKEIKHGRGNDDEGKQDKADETRIQQISVASSKDKDHEESRCCHALARVVGIMEVDGDIQHVVDQWRSLALVCAMLTSIAAAGLFTSAEYLHTINGEVSKNNTNGKDKDMRSQHIIAKLTVMIFCVDTFCFLNTTVMSTFFIAFASRHPHHSLKQLYMCLGMVYHWPQLYFRIGFFLMVLGLSLFFVLVLEPVEMGSCLGFCVTLIVLPMCFAMARAFRLFTLIEEDTGKDVEDKDVEMLTIKSRGTVLQ